MPRPTPAQLAYGSLTVVLSTLAMLLLSGARSGPGVVAIAAAGLMLGLLVTSAVVLQSRRVSVAPALTASASTVRMAGGTEARVSEHSLRS